MPKKGFKSVTLSEFEYEWINVLAKKENLSIRKAIVKRFNL
jgi:hypothetical protein